ncbi:MAG: ATP-dependent RecD-like DNA helicase [Solumvirus sp.]|uniref:ATP-dependent RecD-like DNA helicase n=1 Tax=Solumvirus sp. TaxID=2487773 RepID=A0A3G5AIK9_9VIRU|nr:MAG: ATP-dependent RecD-like DNA helicase [Solumvirus sp.]
MIKINILKSSGSDGTSSSATSSVPSKTTPQDDREKEFLLTGYISQVAGLPTKVFTVVGEDRKSYLISTGKYFCPIKVGDIFMGLVKSHKTYQEWTASMLQEPLITMSRNFDVITKQLLEDKSLKLSISVVNDFFSEAKKKVSSSTNNSKEDSVIINAIDKMAEDFLDVYGSDKDISLIKFDNVKANIVVNIYEWIHKNRNKRRLWLLGLNNKEIKECHRSCLAIFEQCLKNPLVLTNLSIEKCKLIARRFLKTLSNEQIEDTKIARFLQDNVNMKCWMCTPLKYLLKKFPTFKDRAPQLQKEYGLIIDDTQPYQFPTSSPTIEDVSDSKDKSGTALVSVPSNIPPNTTLVSTSSSSLSPSPTPQNPPTPPISLSVYLPYQHLVETTIAEFVVDCLHNNSPIIEGFDEKKLLSVPGIDKITDEQRNALITSFSNRLSIITGRAGTGKTTIIKLIILILKHFKIPYRLCAFTGKAASRIQDVTGEPATTIHSLLSNLRGIREVIVIDEASMKYAELFYLLSMRTPKSPFILVGDKEQLSPVSAGSLFDQLLKVPRIPISVLITNHRMYKVEGKVDGILLNANKIIEHPGGIGGTPLPIKFEAAHNFTYINGTKEVVVDIVKQFYKHNIPASKICVITPYNESINYFNLAFQNIYNEGQQSVINNGVKWMLNDRVMALENDYDLGVLNGQEGKVSHIGSHSITVNFANEEHEFGFNKIDLISGVSRAMNSTALVPESKYIGETTDKDGKIFKGYYRNIDDDGKDKGLTIAKLAISYCVTVHKSQGSEYDYVIFYCPEKNTSFLNKNLLYTAFTRARCALFVVSNLNTIVDAAGRAQPPRCEHLADRINKLYPPTAEMVKIMNEKLNKGKESGTDSGKSGIQGAVSNYTDEELDGYAMPEDEY